MGSMASEVQAATERVVEALRRYAEVIDSHPDLPRGVVRSAANIRAGLAELEERVREVSGWSIGLLVLPQEEDENEGEDEHVPGTRLRIRMRYDVDVTDPERLLEAGRHAYLEMWPEDSPEAAIQRVAQPGHAILELLHRHGPGVLGEFYSERHGVLGVEDETEVVVLDYEG